MKDHVVTRDSMHSHCSIKCISWSAVVVGALIGLGISFLLNLFSVAIGLTAFTTSQNGMTALAVGGFLGFAISGIVAMFVGGWFAGYLGRAYCDDCKVGAVYGFVAWCLALFLGILLSAPAAKFVSTSTDNLTLQGRHAVSIHAATHTDESSATREGRTVTGVDADKAATEGAKTAFALFALFFLGAIASCFGGHFGMVSRSTCCPTRSPKI